MNKIPKAQYSPEFREQAVKSFNEGNLTIVEAAKRLSIPKTTLLSWVTADKKGALSSIGKHQKPLTELELELSRFKRELAEVKMERDFIKKCATYFAKTSR
jgi:transposase